MKKLLVTLLMFWIVTGTLSAQTAQQVSAAPPVNNAASATVGPAGTVANSSGLIITVSPGPIFCQGDMGNIHNTSFTLLASTTYQVIFGCASNQVFVRSDRSAVQPAEVNLATVVCGATTCGTITDTRAAGQFPNSADGTFFVPSEQCSGATSGTAGAGNATDIVAGSGGLRVFRLSATAASSSANTFTCKFQVPSRLTAGKGVTINDVTFLVSTQTTQPTSITLPTLKTFTPPAAVDPETANSATFAAAGGTITQAPSSAQFAAYTAVAAGQFFTVKSTLGTPVLVNTDMITFQFVIVFNQSASAISLQETPGFYVHYTTIPL